jgi:hypothetical protein
MSDMSLKELVTLWLICCVLTIGTGLATRMVLEHLL